MSLLSLFPAARWKRYTCVCALAGGLLSSGPAAAQIAPSAYRALGQGDLRQNAPNRMSGSELAAPAGIALDPRPGKPRLYIADTGNHRVLGWADTGSYQRGEKAAVLIGQPGFDTSSVLGIGDRGLAAPSGLAVDPRTGTLYVADTGNHRVLRFPDPFEQQGRIEPDAVLGQPDFGVRAANSGAAVSRLSLSGPLALAFDAEGNLWIADAGNHRVLRYAAAALAEPAPGPDLVLGQATFEEGTRDRGAAVSGSGFASPSGLVFDKDGNLYVAELGNARVLRFTPPFAADSAASAVYGQSSATVREAVTDLARALTGPVGMAAAGARLYIALPLQNRVLVWDTAAGNAAGVLGQPSLTVIAANAGSGARAHAEGLSGVFDVKTDGENIYVADTNNHRVLRFAREARAASEVWGQTGFDTNSANQAEPGSLSRPYKVAIDYSQQPFALYVSDTNNHRVLGWRDAVRFRTGDPADFVIGQPDLYATAVNSGNETRKPSASSFASPRGVVVDEAGNLWVADWGNNRVLRFPRPVDQTERIAADVVLGQENFTSNTSDGVSATTVRAPAGLALGPDGHLFVADSGNNRVLEFPAGAASGSAALRVYGQPDMSTGEAPAAASAQSLASPTGVAVDAAANLYVADTGANRVLVFANTREAPESAATASVVIGSDRFEGPATGGNGARLNSPLDVALDSSGRIYVSDFRNYRVLVFPSVFLIPITDSPAVSFLGGRSPAAPGRTTGPESLAEPAGLTLDRRDTLYVADSANHRVLHFLKDLDVRHGANPVLSVMPRGGLIDLVGENLAPQEQTQTPPLAASLAEREVVVNEELAAPILSASGERLRVQLPWETPAGMARVAIRAAGTGEWIAGLPAVPVAAYAPGLFARVVNEDGRENSAANPAPRGGVVRFFGTGQGPVTPPVGDGQAAAAGASRTVASPTSSGVTCLTTQPSVCVAVGTAFGTIRFSGLAGGEVGTWQLDVQVPSTTIPGEVPVRAVVNGTPTNLVRIHVRQ